MYSEKLAIAIKHNGSVLREHGDAVYIPFGSDYSIFLKNLNSLRAIVSISIDGQDAFEGTGGMIISPNQSINLERFIKNGNLSQGNRFKFIERTAKIEDGPRGIRIDDGLIRVEFEFEQRQEEKWYNTPYVRQYSWTHPGQTIGGTYTHDTNSILDASFTGSLNSTLSVEPTSGSTLRSVKTGHNATSATVQAQNAGITVPGAVSNQSFDVGDWFPTDGKKHAMVLRLIGMFDEKPVQAPVTVKTKQKCSTCGHLNKSGAKFCIECGTALDIV